ncbi:nucleotidyl transferase AbiEii/AbiGii toxin family protein [Candidatus Woesearchaeota archaeon]|nr:nucleotidyl transferase AbiEii/AbiGii toxin family protein [Candidatus Woesearchaeota archaeon]
MLEQFVKRENAIFAILHACNEQNLLFIVVGGYAVSAYKHRFSVDIDLVIKNEDKELFETILKRNQFVKTIAKDLDHVYASEFIRYETKGELPVSVDLLIDGVGSRTTHGSFSFDELFQHCRKRKIIGIEQEAEVCVPNRELLIILKLHAGRLTDYRDIVAIAQHLDIKMINKIIWRGNKDNIKKHIMTLLNLLKKKEFIDSFKGVFIEKRYDVDIEEVKKLECLL